MQCRLALCRSFRRDFPLEPFTRGLASEDADQHAQRFVAVIAQRSLPCYASKSPISLPSRPDHNATAPPVVDLCIRAQPVREPTDGHYVIAGPTAQPRRGQARQPARDGAKRSGLTAPRTAGQSRVVMAAVSGYEVAQREYLRDERDAQVGRQAGGDGQVTVSGADSVRVRVHQYERCFRQKPDRRVPADEINGGATHDLGGALGDVHGRSAVLPDDSDMHLGRERPPQRRPGTVIGGWQRGSLTPQMFLYCGRQPR